MKPIGCLLVLVIAFGLAFEVFAVTRYVDLNSPNPTQPYTSWATAATNIQDAVDVAGDGDMVLVTNGVYRVGGRLVSRSPITNRVAVTKALALRSVNGPTATFVEGNKVPGSTNGSSAIRCIYLTNLATLSGFTLTNGASPASDFYPLENTGGGVWAESPNAIITNCLIVGNSAAYLGGGVYSGTLVDCTLNGNQSDVAGGGAAASVLMRCTVSENASQFGGGTAECSLTNCLISDNWGGDGGGGVMGGVLSECVISNNLVAIGSGGGTRNSSLYQCLIVGNNAHVGGGGAAGGLVDKCVVSNNVAGIIGGGVDSAFVNQSILVSNLAESGGGASACQILNSAILGNSGANGAGGTYNCDLLNSIVYYNQAPANPNYEGCYFRNSCTTPLLMDEEESFESEPLFVNIVVGNFQLQSNSPCINAGTDPVRWPQTNSTDLAGQARKIGGTIDVGPFEFQSPSSVLSYTWAQQYGLPTDGTADFADTDADGMSNYGEWRSDTVPTNKLSVLRMVSATKTTAGTDLTWQGVATRRYWLERATNLGAAFSFQTVATDIPGEAGRNTFMDRSATNGDSYFYRVGVQ